MDEVLFYIVRYGTYVIYGMLLVIVFKFIISKKIKSFHSRWHTSIDNFEFSPKEFYSRLKTELQSHGISKINIKEVYLKEGGAVSSSRIYLRAHWKNYQYDICSANFGKGFFISWWLLYKDSIWKIIISKIPFVGGWIAQKLFPITYYSIDTASMFMSYAQSSVLKVINDITEDKGTRALTENERKPILNDIFKR